MGVLELITGLFKKKKKKGKKSPLKASAKGKIDSGVKTAGKVAPKHAPKATAKLKLDTTKYAEHVKRLEEVTKEQNIGRTKSLLVELTRTAYTLSDAIAEREKTLKQEIDSLTKAVDQKDPAIAGSHASQLITLSTLMADPIFEAARDIINAGKTIEEHVINRKTRSAKPDISKLIEAVATLDAMINARTGEASQLGNKVNAALLGRDYHTVTSLSEQLSKDSAVLSVMLKGRSIELPQEKGLSVLSGGGDRLTNLKKKVSELKKATMERNFLGAMELARNISQNAALVANPNLAKATSLLEQAEKLKRALKTQDQPTALSLAESIHQAAGVFRGQSQDRQKQILDFTNKLRQEFAAHRPQGVLAAATSIWREAAVLSDATFARAITLAAQIPQIETAIKEQDLPQALLTIERIIA